MGTRGSWAEFATDEGWTYYVHILTGERSWKRPTGFDHAASRRGAAGAMLPPGALGVGHSNIYVGNLPPSITNDSLLRQLFANCGNIISLKLVAQSRYGFIKFSRPNEAQKAIDTMNGLNLQGLPLAVRIASKDRM